MSTQTKAEELANELERIGDAFDVQDFSSWSDEAAAELRNLAKSVDGWRELCRRLYVELFHCDQQMTSTMNDEGDQVWETGVTVRDVLRDAKAALGATPSAPTAVEPDERTEFARRYEWLRAQVWNENTLAVVLRPKDNTTLGCFLPFGKLLDDAIDHMSASKGTPI